MKSVMKLIDADDVINRIQQYSKMNNTLYEFSQKNVILLLQKAPEVNINDIKSETVKEFAERLKESFSASMNTGREDFPASYICDVVDEILEEMEKR